MLYTFNNVNWYVVNKSLTRDETLKVFAVTETVQRFQQASRCHYQQFQCPYQSLNLCLMKSRFLLS